MGEEHQTKLGPGQIQFHQWCEPPLEPGDYTVNVTQSVTELEATDGNAFNNNFSFSVAGPRFSLDPSEIYGVYPPKNHSGDFANSLPHIVFTRRTLPWERSVHPGPRQNGDKLPWMALLVFSAADFLGNAFPELKLLKVGDLINPKDPVVGPSLGSDGKNGLAAYEKESDLCSTIELPWTLFQNVAPSLDDLGYLAHVREVNTGSKETLSFLADGWFSVVVANRFPEPAQPLSVADLGDIASLLKKLRSGADKVSEYLWQRFSETAQAVLKDETSDATKQQQQRFVLLGELNRIVRGESIYDAQRFENVSLSTGTRELRDKLKDKKPEGSEAAQFNKSLLQDAYPKEIAKIPPAESENRAYLVSLEGMTDYLPGAGKPAAEKPVRLAVLSSWSFRRCAAFGFKASMNKLKVRRLAVPGLDDAAKTDAEKYVNDASKTGYTALSHSSRLGERAVSWYRGPLVPLLLQKQSKFIFRPVADAALRYSLLDGMMDVSYAAAYQLGRLLALQDRHFATALYAYRRGVQQQINDVLGRKRLESIFGAGTGNHASEIMSSYVRKLTPPNGAAASEKEWAVAQPAIQQFQKGESNPNALNLTTDFDLTIPQTVCRWLARLVLLYRVPFTYLVPDERMLPPDNMRFFYLDPNWIKCLLEGACSVGRSSSRDELVDEYLRDKFLDFALEQSLDVRTKTPTSGAADPINIQQKPEKLPNWPLTGFLLRSPAVEGWQGLEMRAWTDSGANPTKPLDPLRIDRLAPEIMLCIFNGTVNRIEVKQPPEGMHFGAAVEGESFQKYHLRRLDKSEPGGQLGDDSKTMLSLRQQDVKRVVDVSALAEALKQKLKHVNAGDNQTDFTSADFGVEMVESPGRVVFDVNNKEGADA